MKPVAWLYIKMFLVFGLGYGLLMTAIDPLLGSSFQLSQFLFRTIVFGGLMSLTLVSIHLVSLRSKGVRNFTPDNLKVTQKRSIESPLNKKQLVEKIKTDFILNAMKITETENEVKLKSDMTLTSWGDLISIRVDDEFGSLHHYEIVSKPILKTTLLDYGSNYEHVSRLERLML